MKGWKCTFSLWVTFSNICEARALNQLRADSQHLNLGQNGTKLPVGKICRRFNKLHIAEIRIDSYQEQVMWFTPRGFQPQHWMWVYRHCSIICKSLRTLHMAADCFFPHVREELYGIFEYILDENIVLDFQAFVYLELRSVSICDVESKYNGGIDMNVHSHIRGVLVENSSTSWAYKLRSSELVKKPLIQTAIAYDSSKKY